ncbi:MAG: hypothetical protein C4522_10785 [Desulfobacteraceae bacterium]|nr:MAG: hypothetical protein C4522_10785 [Desulfobacteraceae bacterium]
MVYYSLSYQRQNNLQFIGNSPLCQEFKDVIRKQFHTVLADKNHCFQQDLYCAEVLQKLFPVKGGGKDTLQSFDR